MYNPSSVTLDLARNGDSGKNVRGSARKKAYLHTDSFSFAAASTLAPRGGAHPQTQAHDPALGIGVVENRCLKSRA